jgi:hypothetical protein
MTQEEAAELLQKYLAGEATENETSIVESWYGSIPGANALAEDRKKLIAESMRVNITNAIRESTAKTSFRFSPWIKAAAVLACAYYCRSDLQKCK